MFFLAFFAVHQTEKQLNVRALPLNLKLPTTEAGRKWSKACRRGEEKLHKKTINLLIVMNILLDVFSTCDKFLKNILKLEKYF